jgi:hypothetical protein
VLHVCIGLKAELAANCVKATGMPKENRKVHITFTIKYKCLIWNYIRLAKNGLARSGYLLSDSLLT